MSALEREKRKLHADMAKAKTEMSLFLQEQSQLVYENQYLRQIANVDESELLDLTEIKLKDKVSATKAIATQKQLEREIILLEEERLVLKTKLRRLAALTAERSALFHALSPEQMLQLEEVAQSLRDGALELPRVDDAAEWKKVSEFVCERVVRQLASVCRNQ